MKKLGGILTTLLVAASLLLLPHAARADEKILFSGISASGTYGCSETLDGTMIPCDLNGFRTASIQFTCPSDGCLNEIKVWQRNSPNDAYAVVIDQFNTGVNEMGFSNAAYGQIYVEIIWTAGVLQGTLLRLN